MKKYFALLLIALLTTILVGCGAEEDNTAGNIQTVNIVAEEWVFTPSTVEVTTGKVKFIIENKGERMHGFAIKELGIDETLAPKQTIEKVYQIDQAGTYQFTCSILCGTYEQHVEMSGQLIVK